MNWAKWRRVGQQIPSESWSIFHPRIPTVTLVPKESLKVKKSKTIPFIQAHVRPSKLQTQIFRLGTAIGVSAAVYQFITNLHVIPITNRLQVVALSQEDECDIGNESAQEDLQNATFITHGPRYRMCMDVTARLIGVSEHLFPRNYDWEVYLVDDPNIQNASCYPGGKIVIYTGMLDLLDMVVDQLDIVESKHAALAVVLSHEIGHALARHTAETLSLLPLSVARTVLTYQSPLLVYLFQYLMDLPTSRRHEAEADHIGIMLMASACYDPIEAPRFWFACKKLHEMEGGSWDLDFLSTHPSDSSRQRKLEKLVEEARQVQKSRSWCVELQERVVKALRVKPDSDVMRRMRLFLASEDGMELARRTTVNTRHEMENVEIQKAMDIERKQHAVLKEAQTSLE